MSSSERKRSGGTLLLQARPGKASSCSGGHGVWYREDGVEDLSHDQDADTNGYFDEFVDDQDKDSES